CMFTMRSLHCCPQIKNPSRGLRRHTPETHFFAPLRRATASVSSRNFFCISGSRLTAAVAFSHNLLSIHGEPDWTAPPGISCEKPLCEVMVAPSPTSRCPAEPTCPAKLQPLP